jgi:hypothetical protein
MIWTVLDRAANASTGKEPLSSWITIKNASARLSWRKKPKQNSAAHQPTTSSSALNDI